MPSYTVLKRMIADQQHMPGEILVDPENVDILVQRGFLQEIPHKDLQEAALADAGDRPQVAELVAQGYSEKAASHIVKGTAPLPKYVQEEQAKITERQARIEDRSQAEIDRLALVVGGSATDIADLSDEDYKELLAEHPNPTPAESGDPELVGDGEPPALQPFEALMAMRKDDLLAVMQERSVATPENEEWFKDEAMRANAVRAILEGAGYSGDALQPTPEPETSQS